MYKNIFGYRQKYAGIGAVVLVSVFTEQKRATSKVRRRHFKSFNC
jgi:hypothetical protein